MPQEANTSLRIVDYRPPTEACYQHRGKENISQIHEQAEQNLDALQPFLKLHPNIAYVKYLVVNQDYLPQRFVLAHFSTHVQYGPLPGLTSPHPA